MTRTQRKQRTQRRRAQRRRGLGGWVIAAVLAASAASAPLRSASFAPSASLSQAAPQPTFRSSTRLIVQTVTVKDRDGKPIEGLTAKDFIVTEDGEPQTVAFVEYQRVDGSREQQPAVNTAPLASTPEPSPAPATT